MNQDQIKSHIKALLQEIGEDPNREGLIDTPKRVAKSYEKLFEGYGKDPKDVVTTFDSEHYDEMIIIKDIDFFSMCEHHILPFFGRVHVGYLPTDKIIGASKIPRIVDIFARRLQNQERLTKQVADTLTELLSPKGIGVVMEAEHLCMKARGVEKQNTIMTTSSFTGLFRSNMNTRTEFLNLIKNK